ALGARFRPDAWYDDLAKPSWQPPKWVFATVWTGCSAGIDPEPRQARPGRRPGLPASACSPARARRLPCACRPGRRGPMRSASATRPMTKTPSLAMMRAMKRTHVIAGLLGLLPLLAGGRRQGEDLRVAQGVGGRLAAPGIGVAQGRRRRMPAAGGEARRQQRRDVPAEPHDRSPACRTRQGPDSIPAQSGGECKTAAATGVLTGPAGRSSPHPVAVP
ncbi:tryptophan-rich sensory protein, partial [bacterium]|nr:tryptophan-rich sensory protein [bacterium]